MKKYLIVDISGKVPKYDEALYKAVSSYLEDASATLMLPGHGLLSLVPKRNRNTENIIKRLVKVVEGLLNYLYISIFIVKSRPTILHLQWLPFIEFVGWEIPIIFALRKLSSNTSFILTIHNVYPHEMNDKAKVAYKARFKKIAKQFDAFIVHTKTSKIEVVQEFNLEPDKVHVCCHGVFETPFKLLTPKRRREGKLHILQFGNQSFYKGTDILVDAVCGLDEFRKSKLETHISGSIGKSFHEELIAKDKDCIVEWNARFLEDKELYKAINDADIIVLPYRAISQSGVLLQSLFFEKLIICSDLPSFVETMRGEDGNDLDSFLFFKNEDATSLRLLLEKYIDGNIEEVAVLARIKKLKKLYSWDNAAKSTFEVYEACSQKK